MANTLSAELLAAQEDVSRHPIIEVKAGQFKDDLPLLGDYLNDETLDQDNSTTIMHSSGRLIMCYSQQNDAETVMNRDICLAYTDVDRQMFEYKVLAVGISSNIVSDLVLLENADGTLALFYILKSGTTYSVKCMKFAYDGSSLSTYVIISGTTLISALSALRTSTGYMIAYAKDLSLTVSAVGTYTGASDDVFYTEVLTDGSNATATFRWKKGINGAWSNAITMTGGNQALSDGMSIKFNANSYWAGQTYNIPVTAATYAKGYVTCENLPVDGQTTVIGSRTYTWRNTLSSPAVAYEVKIDALGREICLENLRCAIMAGTFEGTGAGVRYGTGTAANTLATAIRNERTLTLTAIASGTSGNNITLTVDGTNLVKVAFLGGAAAITGAIVWLAGNKAYKATCATLAGTWTTDVEIIIDGINESRRKIDSALFQAANGEIFYFFSYMSAGDSSSINNVYNVLYSRSLDVGVNWQTAIALTSFTTSAEIARRPNVLQRTGGEIILIYDAVRASRVINNTNPYWTGSSSLGIKYLHFNPVNRKLYVPYGIQANAGDKILYGILRIDVDMWAVDRYWNQNTAPSIPLIFRERHSFSMAADGDILAFAGEDTRQILVVDGAANTIRILSLVDNSSYRLVRNVDNVPWHNPDYTRFDYLGDMALDASSNTLYFSLAYVGYQKLILASLDYSEEKPSCTKLADIVATGNEFVGSMIETGRFLLLDKAHGYLICSSHGLSGNTAGTRLSGGAWIFDAGGGGLIKAYKYSATMPQFPFYGGKLGGISGDWLYMSPWEFTLEYGQENLYGVVAINLVTDIIKWHTPSVFVDTAQSMGISGLMVCGNSLYMGSSTIRGIISFDLTTELWGLINNTTVAGIFPTTITDFNSITLAYDEFNGFLFMGSQNFSDGGVRAGVVCFPESGKLEQTQYAVGQELAGDWVFGEALPLVMGQRDYNASAALEVETNSMFVFWTHWTKETNGQIYWDKESGTLDLTELLVKGQAITQTRAIDGTPSTFSFSLSKGHLLDSTNTASLLARYLKKGKKILVRYGQKINGSDYWQDGQSVYVLTSKKLSYKREEYPIMEVECEDVSTWWDEQNIITSAYYSGVSPSAVIADILQNYSGVAQTAIDSSLLDAETPVYIQFVDTTVKDVIDTICNRYGVFHIANLNDNKVCFKPISQYTEVSHVYTDLMNLISWSPDDAYSSFTNRVTVTGESRIELEVMTEEESVGTRSGTLGFFCKKQVDKIYFSDDHEKRVRNVRLNITQSLSSIGFRMGGKMKTFISDVDAEGHWVEVTSEGPNLMPVFLAGLSLIVAGKFASSHWDVALKHNLVSAGLIICMEVLAAVGNFSYEILGNPIGEVKQSLQATVNDVAFQQELRGTIVENKFEDELCYDVAHCQRVAAHELWVVQAQRNRIKLIKNAHLQDDAGDSIILPHPFTKQGSKILITNLTRTLTIPSTEGDDGEFKDEIEGWVI